MIKVRVNYKTDKSRLRKVVKDTQKMSLYVGVKKGLEDCNIDGVSIYEAYKRNEFGYPTGNIPERSFIRKPAKEKAREYFEAHKEDLVGLLFKESVNKVLKDMGIELQQYLTDNLTTYGGIDGSWKGNATFTINKKGFDFPLFVDGTLASSIGYEVKKGD